MSAFEILMIMLFVALAGGIMVMAVILFKRPDRGKDSPLNLLQQQMAGSIQQQDNRLAKMNEQLAASLKDLTAKLDERLGQAQLLAQQGQKNMSERLEVAGKTFAEIKGQLGQLGQAAEGIMKVGGEVRKLQDILQSPKLRGGLGEWSLENLLREVLPDQNIKMQYRFNNGYIVDALIELAEGRVAIDAKFPLPNFQAMLETEDDTQRPKYRKAFLRDVRNRIDEIAGKYIVPEEGTLDFALMYVPAENVYYETIIDNEISEYSRQRRVLLVSPNTLYAYLMVVAVGLRGLQIEKNAQAIRQQLGQLAGMMDAFNADFQLLGKHLNNARAKHEDATRKLTDLDMRIKQIESESDPRR